MTTKRNDSVFQLSLTELAFILLFIFLLLAGCLQLRESEENESLRLEHAELTRLEVIQHEADRATSELTQALKKSGTAREEETRNIIDSLSKSASLRAENSQLRLRVDNLEREIFALQEVRRILDSQGSKQLEQEVESALAFQKELSDVGGRPVSLEDKKYLLQIFEQKEKEGGIASADERAPDSFSEAVKQNNDLRGQIAYLQKRLDRTGAGLDHPPCWADRYGQIQYFLRVRIRKNGLEVERAWPAQRDEDARSLPNFDLATDPQLKTHEVFRSHMNEIYRLSVREDCRYFVILTNTVYDDVWLFNEYRKTVERFFYVLDLT